MSNKRSKNARAKLIKLRNVVSNKQKTSLEYKQYSMKEALEIFAFENAQPLNEQLILTLISKGWIEQHFQTIAEIAPRCECPCQAIMAYYNKKRDSVLFENKNIDAMGTIEILKNGDIKFYNRLIND